MTAHRPHLERLSRANAARDRQRGAIPLNTATPVPADPLRLIAHAARGFGADLARALDGYETVEGDIVPPIDVSLDRLSLMSLAIAEHAMAEATGIDAHDTVPAPAPFNADDLPILSDAWKPQGPDVPPDDGGPASAWPVLLAA